MFKLGQDMFTTMHHNKIVTIEGIIKQAKPVTPELIIATFRCEACGKKIELQQGGGKCKLLPPEKCISKSCNNDNQNFEFIQKTSKFIDYQEVWLMPKKPPKIRLGRGQKVILKKELVGGKEGENIRITGKLGFELKGRTNFAEPVVIASKIKRLD